MTSLYWDHCFSHDEYTTKMRKLVQGRKYVTIEGEPSESDPFGKLPTELRQRLIGFCEIASNGNLAKASRAFKGSQGLPMSEFKDRCLREFSWFPNLEERLRDLIREAIEEDRIDWFYVYRIIRKLLPEHGIRNRIRIYHEFTHIAQAIIREADPS